MAILRRWRRGGDGRGPAATQGSEARKAGRADGPQPAEHERDEELREGRETPPDTTRDRSAERDRDQPPATVREEDEPREDREEVAAETRGAPRASWAPVGTETGTSTWTTLKRAGLEFSEDGMTDWAAALTYYGLLSLFPALIALTSVLGLFADPQETSRAITDVVTQIGPSTAAETFSGPIESITSNQETAGVLLVVGLATALWSASGYIGAFIRASNVIWETREGRSFFKLRPLQIAVTLAMVLSLALVALALVLTGPVVEAVGNAIGLGETAVTVWDIAKWPVLLVVLMLIISLLYYAAPNVKVPGFKWITPGGVVAVITWIVASALFAFYVANFGSYDKTYGTLGGLIALLVWFWISNLALLFGMELNAERERSRELAAGVPRAHKEIQLEPRDEPNEKRTT